jgi:hypothetical protein
MQNLWQRSAALYKLTIPKRHPLGDSAKTCPETIRVPSAERILEIVAARKSVYAQFVEVIQHRNHATLGGLSHTVAGEIDRCKLKIEVIELLEAEILDNRSALDPVSAWPST